MKRADGYTEEQIKRWCSCIRQQEFDGPDQECPLHGGYVVEWSTFTLNAEGLPIEPIGLPYVTDESPHPEALEQAEYELADIIRCDGPDHVLRYRLISPWLSARASSLCNCGGPSPEGQHEPHCAENGLTESLGHGHKHFGYTCVYCNYSSPFFNPTLESARAMYADHLTRCIPDGQLDA